ncbi:MAG: hypothetical protein ABI175_21515, partial [Polyangiales bacterium]
MVATAKLEVRGTQTDAGIKVFGKLIDDAGQGLGGQQVYVSVARAESPTVALALPEPLSPVKRVGDEYLTPTNTDGAFAFDIPVEPLAYEVSVRTEKTPFVAATKESLHLEPGKKGVELSFPLPPAPPSQIDLDAPKVTIKVTVTSEGIEQDGFAIDLKDSANVDAKVLASATSVRGIATFELPPEVFGPPGSGEIVAWFAGASGFSSSRTRAFVRRSAVARFIDVRPEDPKGGVAADGIPIVGRIASKDDIGASGIVEVFLVTSRGTENVGAANVEEGAFRVVPRWRAKEEGIATLSIRFTPSSEGWIAQDPGLDLNVRVRTPGPWRAIAAIVAGLALIFMVIRSRRPPKLSDALTQTGERDPVVRVAKRARAPKVVEITVRDRRRRTPIAGARVRASRPTATSADKIGEGVTTGDGRLRLVLSTPVRAGDQLLITQRAFLPLAIELPRATEVEFALTRRRDAVLDALLGWSRGMLRRLPFQPTPGDVSVAVKKELADPLKAAATSWSDAVEGAAFGSRELDEAEQRRIQTLADATTGSVQLAPPPP